jgi:hypothetical protein
VPDLVLVLVLADQRDHFSELYDGGYHGVPEPLLSQLLLGHHDLVGVRLGIVRPWFDDSDAAVQVRDCV